jgi:hypothetical protein
MLAIAREFGYSCPFCGAAFDDLPDYYLVFCHIHNLRNSGNAPFFVVFACKNCNDTEWCKFRDDFPAFLESQGIEPTDFYARINNARLAVEREFERELEQLDARPNLTDLALAYLAERLRHVIAD